MTRRSMITVLLMMLLIPLNEVHNFWNESNYNISPFWFTYKPLNVEWFVKFLGEKMSWCIAGVIFYRLARWNRELKIAGAIFIVYSVIDLLLFFGWFNQTKYYLIIYSSFCFISGCVMFLKIRPQKENKFSKAAVS